MECPKCESGSMVMIAAEIRLFRNSPRTLSHPPMTPAPDIQVCLDCGWSVFVIPQAWLAAGWLRSLKPQEIVNHFNPPPSTAQDGTFSPR